MLAQQAAVVPNPDFADALWLTVSDSLRKLAATDGALVLISRTETTLQPLALAPQRGRVWSYGTNTLKAFTFTGQLALTVPVPPVSGDGDDNDDDDDGRAAHLAVNGSTGSVWLGRNTQLLHLSAAGQLLHTLTLPITLRALAFAGVSQRLWAATTTACGRMTSKAHW